MALPEKSASEARQLTRRFRDQAEVRLEVDRNLLSGTIWLPLESTSDLHGHDRVEVHLVLPDGRVVDTIKGHVVCVAPAGVAVMLDELRADLLAVLIEENAGVDDFRPPPELLEADVPALKADMPAPRPATDVTRETVTPAKPEETEPVDGWGDERVEKTPDPLVAPSAPVSDPAPVIAAVVEPALAAAAEPAPIAPKADPFFGASGAAEIPPPAEPAPVTAPADPAPIPPAVEPAPISAPADPFFGSAAPASAPVSEPAPVVAEDPFFAAPSSQAPVHEIDPTEPPPLAVTPAAPAPVPVPDVAPPVAIEPIVASPMVVEPVVEPPVIAPVATPEPPREEADFPVLRPADINPVPSMLTSDPSAWAEPSETSWSVGVPVARADERPVMLALRVPDRVELRRIYDSDLSIGRVVVPTREKLKLEQKVEVAIALPPKGDPLRLVGQVSAIESDAVTVRVGILDTSARTLIGAALEPPPDRPPTRPQGADDRLGNRPVTVAAPAAPSPVAPPSSAPTPSAAPAAPAASAASAATPPPSFTSPVLGAALAPLSPDPVAPAAPVPATPPADVRPPAGPPARAELIFPFSTLRDFKREYETNISKGGVLVPTATPPAIRAPVEVVFVLLGGKREVRIRGEVVFHAPGGAGVQLAAIPSPVKLDIDALLAAASVVNDGAPKEPIVPSVAASPVAIAKAVPDLPAAAPRVVFTSPAAAAAAKNAPPAASGEPFEGDLVEVLREAEVEGEARVEGQVGGHASWLKVLANLQSQKATGLLEVTRKGETKRLLIYLGRVVDAAGTPPRHDESLLAVTRKHNLLKPGSIRVLEKAVDGATDEYEGLVAAGVWTPQEIDRLRRWQLIERAADVFSWEKGRYKYDPNGDRAWARPTAGVPVGHVILHGMRSNIRASGEDLARVMRTALDRPLVIVSGTGFEPTRVGMSDKELRFWSDIDGAKSLRSLLTTTPIGAAQTYRLVFALCRLGVLSLSGDDAKSSAKKDDGEAIRGRLADMKSRDPFARLGLSWMASGPQIQLAWDQMRAELALTIKAGGPVGDVCREIYTLGEQAFKQLSEERSRRLLRLKLIEDPGRIEASAEMLAEKADILHLRGDHPGAVAAIQMALDLSPENANFKKLAAQLLAR